MSKNKRVKEVRIFLKYQQGEFADLVGLKQGTLSGIEKEKSGVTSDLIEILYEKFNVNPIWLISGKGDMFNDNTAAVTKIETKLKDERIELLESKIQLLELKVDHLEKMMDLQRQINDRAFGGGSSPFQDDQTKEAV